MTVRDSDADSGAPTVHFDRRSFLATGAATAGAALAGCIGGSGSSTPTINVLTWEHYARDDIKSAVESELDVELEIKKSTSSANMFSGWKSGQDEEYDIAVPNNNYVPKFVDAGLVAPAPLDDLSNYGSIYDQFEQFTDSQLSRDGQAYGVPIRFGWYGYGYDSRDVPDHEESWSVLFEGVEGADLSNKVALYDNHFKAMGAAALHLGYRDAFEGDRVSLSQKQIDEVKRVLVEQKKEYLSGYIAGDASFTKGIKKGDFHVGHSGRMNLTILWNNDNDWAKMASPKEGAMSWFEAAVVSKKSENQDLAWEIVDEYISPENGATLSRVGHAPSVNPKVENHLDEKNNRLYGSVDPERLNGMIPFKAVENEDAWRSAWEEVKTA
ncbi:ABC transporter substrate-binding protein [Halorussus salinisoli]|uniref:ABC transporter substrate-binding protein n=1 Tax=Halorussus salinisoli TaxID=2558242 RepID=UPI0010C1FF29|nr:PotD/PotF family extracellular solute-binding protein [Halorussus salinisoli]